MRIAGERPEMMVNVETMSTYVGTETLAVVECWCGIRHAIPRSLRTAQIKARDEHRTPISVHCPIGHAWLIAGDSQLDVVNRQLAAERAADLTRQLLLFARRGTANRAVCDLNAVAQETVDLVRRPIGPRTEIVLHLASDPCLVEADRGQLEQVLMNLLLNARDATPDGGSITVTTTVCSVPPGGDMEPGHYVLLCNVAAHYAAGQRADFTVR